MMRKATLLLACLVCAGQGRRVQPTAQPENSLEADAEASAAKPCPQSTAELSAAYIPSGAPARSISVSSPGIASSKPPLTSSVVVGKPQASTSLDNLQEHRAPPTSMSSLATGNNIHGMSQATLNNEATRQKQKELKQLKAELQDLKDMLEERGGNADLTEKINRLEAAQNTVEKVQLDDLRSQIERIEVSQAEKQTLEKTLGALKWIVGGSVFGFLSLFSLTEKIVGRRRSGYSAVSRSGVPQMSSAAADNEQSKKGFLQGIKDALPAQKEAKKMLPLAFIFFCMLFNYTVLRDTKDVLVVTSGGAEVIPFLKTYLNLPAAIAFNAIYFGMVNRMSSARIFYTIMAFFVVFFGSFAFAIFPFQNYLHPISWATDMAARLPAGFGPIISIIKFWTFGAFYTFAELWGSVVVSVLFWGFANSVCSVSEAKRWYPLFGMLANVALIFSGQFVRRVSSMRENLPVGVDPWGYSLKILMTAIVIGASIIVGTYTYMQRCVLTDPECVPQNMQRKTKKEKMKMSMGDSIKYLASSSYIRNLFFLVIAYGTSINIVEVTWKGKLKQAFPNPNEYSSFMGAFSSCTGTVTLFMMFLSRWILTRFGWGVASLVTPIMLGITGITFFSLILFTDAWSPLTAALGVSPLMMAVLVGAAQNILSKASKYSLFDPCKETAYIPLDNEMRTKGKAAIDVIGNPMGKSGGAFIQQICILTCGSLAASAPLLGGVLTFMIFLWIRASRDLAVEFEAKSSEPADKEDEPAGSGTAAAS